MEENCMNVNWENIKFTIEINLIQFATRREFILVMFHLILRFN